ncbi:hypothetical protein [Planobispora takensis]|nr:hypothetical protein [Planobispora takensis]
MDDKDLQVLAVWIATAIGPRMVGGRYYDGYWGTEDEVLDIDRGPHEGWLPWTITVRDEHGERWHCTAWDPQRDKVVFQPADTDPMDAARETS